MKRTFILACALALTGLSSADEKRSFFKCHSTEIGTGTALGVKTPDLFAIYDKDAKENPVMLGVWKLDKEPLHTTPAIEQADSELYDLTQSYKTAKKHRLKHSWLPIVAGLGSAGIFGAGFGKLAKLGLTAFTNYFFDLRRHEKIGATIAFGALAGLATIAASSVVASLVKSKIKARRNNKLEQQRQLIGEKSRAITKLMSQIPHYQNTDSIPYTRGQMLAARTYGGLRTKKASQLKSIGGTQQYYRMHLMPQLTQTWIAELPTATDSPDLTTGVIVPGAGIVSRKEDHLPKRRFTAIGQIDLNMAETDPLTIPCYDIA